MRIKRFIALLLATLIMCMSGATLARYSDVPADAGYRDALERLSSLGIMSGYDDGSFKPDNYITREQFAKIIITAAGLEDAANTMKGSTVFPDVNSQGWSSGYINAALDKGYITGMADGKFHPVESVTFAQVCTILVRALGYSDQDIPGLWPKNYIEKAKALGLTTDITLASSDALPRWIAAIMIDRLLVTNMKSTGTAATKTFSDSIGNYTECIILADSKTSEKLTDSQILTDKGTYYLKNDNIKLDMGNRYKLVLQGDTINNAYKVIRPVMNISVSSAVDTTITYKDGSNVKQMTLPDKTIYYYQGVKQTYDNLKNLLKANTSIIFVYTTDKSGLEYAVVFDPVDSKPEVVVNKVMVNNKLGSIDLGSNAPVFRNTIKVNTTPQVNKHGELIDASQIKEHDVVYQVTDIWGNNKYILVVDNKIEGEVTGILPNKVSPKTIQVDGKDYELGRDLSINKVNSSAGAFNIGDHVTLLLGQDGKVVDIVNYLGDDSSSYAFVLNTTTSKSRNIEDFNKTTYTAKLMLADGTIQTYRTESEPWQHKGKLVKYKKINDDTVELESLSYVTTMDYTVDKIENKINSSYVADNVRIFNYIYTPVDKDSEVRMLDWSSIPHGAIEKGKVLYINTAGPFSDVNILLLSDIFEEKLKMGVVTRSTIKDSRDISFGNTVKVGVKEFSFSSPAPAEIGAVVRVELNGDSVTSYGLINPNFRTDKIEAVDLKRVKINGRAYRFNDRLAVYFKDITGEITAKGINDIELNKVYTNISVYLDKFGKVETIVITR